MAFIEHSQAPIEPDTKNKFFIVTGVSASGKDYLLDQLRLHTPRVGREIPVLSFGELLAQKTATLTQPVNSRDDLKAAMPQSELRKLIDLVIKDLMGKQPAIVNTHVVYNQQGSLQINPQVSTEMNPVQYLFVWSDPDEIAERRSLGTRKRLVETPDSIFLHQQIAQEVTRLIAAATGAGFTNVYNRTDNIYVNINKISDLLERIS